MKNIEFIDYTKGEFDKLENSKEINDIVFKFLETLEKNDFERLICNKLSNIRIEYKYYSWEDAYVIRIFINPDIKQNINSNNKLECYIVLKDNKLYVFDYISSYNTPNRKKSIKFEEDNIEGWWNYKTNLIIDSKEDIQEVVDFIILKGYAVWGNKWGYITKAGRKARGKLASKYGLIYNKKYSWFDLTRRKRNIFK